MTERKHRILKDEPVQEPPEVQEQAETQTQAEAYAEIVEKLNGLQVQLDACASKSNEYFEGWQRERADFVNYKKRIERDQQLNQQNMIGSISRRYLAVLDDLERAMKTRPTDCEGAKWAEGVELICRKFQSILESDGVKEMALEAGEEFDPNRHEALTHEENPAYQSGQIIEVIQKGYLIGDRVLRPALVRVAR
jgi:molecular chaperone GrpE